MAFRRIRPSSGESSSRSTTSNTLNTPNSSGSDPRRTRADDKNKKEGEHPKRRKVPDNVTRNACVNCKKARAKCDGKTPCKRCLTRGEDAECTYEIHVKHAKEELVKQIKQLRAKEHLNHQLLQAICFDEDKAPEIIARLKNGEGLEGIVEWLGRLPMDYAETLSPKDSHHSGFDGEDHEMENPSSPGGALRWTTVTTDNAVLDHLFQLYFSWVHPVHSLFHEGHFVNSYHKSDSQYCSPILVNAICAMACHLHHAAESDKVNFAQLASDFADEVRTSIIDADDTSLTTIQAFAVMFLVDSAKGHALRGSAYLKVATGALSRVAADYERESGGVVWAQTVRGICNLSVEWAQVTFQEPPHIDIDIDNDIEPHDESSDAKSDESLWQFYRREGEPVESRTSYQATTNREKEKLTAIVRDMAIAMYSPRQPLLSAQDILQLYGRLVTWRGDLPSSINMHSRTGEALPHVLSLLVLYSSTVVQLLRPLLEIEAFPTQHIEDIIAKHAQEGLALLCDQYHTQFTCRCQPVLQMYAVLHLIDVIARYSPGGIEGRGRDGPSAIMFGLDILDESSAGFSIAGPLKEMLRRTARACSIRIPEEEPGLDPVSAVPRKVYGLDDFIDACTRPSYVQPVDEIHQRYLESVPADWLVHGADYGFVKSGPTPMEPGHPTAEEVGARNLMQIRNLLNFN